MELKTIRLTHFKNLLDLSFEPGTGINWLVGKNGMGKTNVLDAIYYLSFTKSYTQSIDSLVIHHDHESMGLHGIYQMGDQEERIDIGVQPGQKKVVKRNQKNYKRLVEHIGRFPLVMISPMDRDLVLEGSETRRKFLDGVIGQTNRDYLRNLLSYNKVLGQRNALLKYFAANRNFDPLQLDVYNSQLEQFGLPIFEERKAFIQGFLPRVVSFYERISGEQEPISIAYDSHLVADQWRALFEASLERDKVLTYTSKGIHKDDLKFEIQGHPLKKFGSQGQQKSFLIALKLAQYEMLKEATGKKPILLLDDIFDKLDPNRVTALIDLVNAEFFGQIFITDTHEDRMETILKRLNGSHRKFEIKNGGIA